MSGRFPCFHANPVSSRWLKPHWTVGNHIVDGTRKDLSAEKVEKSAWVRWVGAEMLHREGCCSSSD